MKSYRKFGPFPDNTRGQIDLTDRYNSLPPIDREEIEEDYGMYAKLMPVVIDNVDPFVNALPKDFRVSWQKVTMMILLFFLQCHEALTADEAVKRSHRDIGFQYVLCNTGHDPMRISRSVYYQFLAHILYHEFKTGENLFVNLTKTINERIAVDMGINLHKDIPGYCLTTRMDSMLINTPAEIRGRVGIIYRTIQMALEYIAMCEGLWKIPEELHHFLDPVDENIVIYHNKGVQKEKLSIILAEAEKALALFEDIEKETDVYKHLETVIKQQGKYDENGNLVPEDNKNIKGNTLQSPDFPTATARTKNRVTHIGEVVNFCEATDGNGHSMIHHVSMKANVYSDPQFLIDYLNERDVNGPMEVIITDGAYVTPETMNAAVEKGVILIGTSMPGLVPKLLFSEFTLTEDGKGVKLCPQGHAPIEGSVKYDEEKGIIVVKFDLATCSACSLLGDCPVVEQKKAFKLIISQKVIDRAELYKNFSSEEHAAFARIRNGVESIPSVMRRRYDIDNMRTMRTGLRLAKLYGCVLSYNLLKYRKFLEEKKKLAGTGAKKAS